jgi:hypothetical protein
VPREVKTVTRFDSATTWPGRSRGALVARQGWLTLARVMVTLARLLGLLARAALAVSTGLARLMGRCDAAAAWSRYRAQPPPFAEIEDDTAQQIPPPPVDYVRPPPVAPVPRLERPTPPPPRTIPRPVPLPRAVPVLPIAQKTIQGRGRKYSS